MCIHTWSIVEHHYIQWGYICMQNVLVPLYVHLSLYVHMWDIFKFSYVIVCICMYICTISENECMVTCMPFPSAIHIMGMCIHLSVTFNDGHMLIWVHMWSHAMFLSMIIWQNVLVYLHKCHEQCRISVHVHVWEHVCCFHAVVSWMRMDPIGSYV